MNFVYGRVGKKLFFDPENWGLVGGNANSGILLASLANAYPEHNFYIIGSSDWKKVPEDIKSVYNKNGNIYDTTDHTRTRLPKVEQIYNPQMTYHLDCWKYLESNDIHIDGGFILNGIWSGINIPNLVPKIKKPDEFQGMLPMFYTTAAQIIYVLNKTMCPYLLLAEDPRQLGVGAAKDLFNRKCKVLTQQNLGLKKFKHIKSFEQANEYVEQMVEYKYGHTQKTFFLAETRPSREQFFKPKNILMNLFMNGHGTGYTVDGRYQFISEYVFPNFPETKIYGKWTEQLRQKDSRFQQIRMGNIMHIVRDTKYTVVNSIKPGFITCKPWEMIHMGMIPFLSPDYDKKKLLPLPEFLYLENPQDLKDKIDFLESNPKYYMDLKQELYNLLDPGYYDGTFLLQYFMEQLKSLSNIDFNTVPKQYSLDLSAFMQNSKNK